MPFCYQEAVEGQICPQRTSVAEGLAVPSHFDILSFGSNFLGIFTWSVCRSWSVIFISFSHYRSITSIFYWKIIGIIEITNKWAKYLKDFWRYGQLYANFGTLKKGLPAILDHMTLKQVKGHQFYLYNLKALTVYQVCVKFGWNILHGYKDMYTSYTCSLYSGKIKIINTF